MDIFKIISVLVGLAGPANIYINYLNNARGYGDKSIDRLKQISEEVKSENPNKWWVEQAFESLYKTNLSFDVIKILIDSKVRHSSIVNLSRITRQRIEFSPHSFERRFTKTSWRKPEVVSRQLTYRWLIAIFLLIISFYVIFQDNYNNIGYFLATTALLLEVVGLVMINVIFEDYRRVWIVYRRRDFGKFHNWFIRRMGRNLPLDI